MRLRYSRTVSVRRNLLILSVALRFAAAHDIITTRLTFTRDISRIFARRCVPCHGQNAAIPLVTYEQARPWAVAIKEQVLSRAMPPFGAVKGFGQLMPDEAMSQEEIMVVAAWVVGGAPKGDLAQLPKTASGNARSVPIQRMSNALVVSTRAVLQKGLEVNGLRPLAYTPVDSARITATLPDGRVLPLVWLYHYDPQFRRIFQFRQHVPLPAGTVVASSAPLEYALEVAGPDQQARR